MRKDKFIIGNEDTISVLDEEIRDIYEELLDKLLESTYECVAKNCKDLKDRDNLYDLIASVTVTFAFRILRGFTMTMKDRDNQLRFINLCHQAFSKSAILIVDEIEKNKLN